MRVLGLLVASLICFNCAFGAETFQPAESSSPPATGLQYDTRLALSSDHADAWSGNTGESLPRGAWEFEGTVGVGAAYRNSSKVVHRNALTELRVGRVMTRVLGHDHWYAGNVEIFGEAIAGIQFNPQGRYFAGFSPILRYNFVTGTRWVPFVDGGAGLAWTDIGSPDLGSNFEFVLQAGPGVKYYFRNNASFIAQVRYLHFSDGGSTVNNHGINFLNLLLGVSWGF